MLSTMFFVIVTLINIQSTIQLNDQATEADRFYVQLSIVLRDSEKHIFYKSTKSTINKFAETFVFSSGNIFKFDSTGKFIKGIKVEGSGPGEFQRRPLQITTADGNLVCRELFKLSFFDRDLNHITDQRINKSSDFGEMIRFDEHVAVVYKSSSSDKYIVFNKNGEIIQTKTRQNKTKSEAYLGMSFNPSDIYTFTNKQFVKRNDGQYELKIYDKELEYVSSVKKHYKRLVNQYYERNLQFHETAKRRAKNSGGQVFGKEPQYYQSDIVAILGSYKNLLFLNMAVDGRSHRIQVIENLTTFVSEFYIDNVSTYYGYDLNRDRLLFDTWDRETEERVVNVYQIIDTKK